MITTFVYDDRQMTYMPSSHPALIFDPDRFLDERVHKYLTPNPFIFCPFNAGPRICLGQQVYNIHVLFKLTQHFICIIFFSSPITKPPSSLLVYCNNSLDLPWINLKTFRLQRNGPVVMVWKELRRCIQLRIWHSMLRLASFFVEPVGLRGTHSCFF